VHDSRALAVEKVLASLIDNAIVLVPAVPSECAASVDAYRVR